MPPRKPISPGTSFSRLTVIGSAGTKTYASGQIHHLVEVLCECGTRKIVTESGLRTGDTKSCGCLHRENSIHNLPSKTTHGMSNTRTFEAWSRMRARCRDPNHQDFGNYGGRGISVCDRWMSLENFIADMGEKPPGLSIDRINNEGNYEPGNCRWTDLRTQNGNRRSVIFVTLDGATVCVAEAARRLGLAKGRLHGFARNRGISHQEAVDHYARRRGRI